MKDHAREISKACTELTSQVMDAFAMKSSFYECYALVDREGEARFAKPVAGFSDGIWDQPRETTFPFQDLPPGATIVDVGGCRGQSSLRLGMRYPQLSFIVQKLDTVIEAAQSKIEVPPSMTDRLKWQTHNLFNPQPVIGADVYLLSHVLMDYNDRECLQLLHRLADAMVPNKSRILIHDYLDADDMFTRRLEVADMLEVHAIACQNTQFRTIAEWEVLLDEAYTGLHIHQVWDYDGGTSLIEVRLLDIEKAFL